MKGNKMYVWAICFPDGNIRELFDTFEKAVDVLKGYQTYIPGGHLYTMKQVRVK